MPVPSITCASAGALNVGADRVDDAVADDDGAVATGAPAAVTSRAPRMA